MTALQERGTGESLAKATNLRIRKAGRDILQDVSLDISRGEIVTLVGPNGAGKTTLVRSLLGIEPVQSGRVWRRDGLRIGYTPQRFDVDASIPMTVRRFIEMGARDAADGVDGRLDEVGASHLSDQQLADLSGGEFQRVLLARALLREPDLLVLDEPVQGVDYIGAADLYRLIARIRDIRGCGVLLVSHDLHVVMSQSDRVVCINHHVCCHGVPDSVAQHPEYQRLFGPEAARAFALYRHAHDHSHGLDGGVAGTGNAHHHDHEHHHRDHASHAHD
jgi:zinc transport system ATP-binding protein